MRVSVVIAAYNAARTVGLAVASACRQTLPPLEVIVVDDGSTDGTAEVARCTGCVVCVSQENRGVAAARNVGVRLARGDYVAVLDADDVWLPQRLERVARVVASRPKRCLVAPDAWVWREPDSADDARARQESVFHHLCHLDLTLPAREALYRNPPIMHPVFPRETLIAEPYDEDLPAYEDTELAWRLVAGGLDVVFLDEPLGLYRMHAASLTGSQPAPLVFQRRLRMLERAGQRCGHDRAAAIAIWRDAESCRRWCAYLTFLGDIRARRVGAGIRGFAPWMAWWAVQHAAQRAILRR